jgi:recombination protein RecR
MHDLPDLVQKLLYSLQQVPYLASKNLYKVANHFLEQDSASIAQFCKTLLDASQQIMRCTRCFTWQQSSQPCFFCDNLKRNQNIICVVESWPDVLTIERTSNFTGLYHVLGGVISPLNGISPSSLTIEHLVKRLEDGAVLEIVLALSQTPEGEATVAYIMDRLQGFSLKISVLAQGMPVGSSLEYMDRVTLMKALVNRKQLL